MTDLIAYLLMLMGQPPQEPVNAGDQAEVSQRGGGIPIQPNSQPTPTAGQ